MHSQMCGGSRTQKVKGIHRNEKQSCKNLHGLKISSESVFLFVFFREKFNGIHNEPEKKLMTTCNNSAQPKKAILDRKLISTLSSPDPTLGVRTRL